MRKLADTAIEDGEMDKGKPLIFAAPGSERRAPLESGQVRPAGLKQSRVPPLPSLPNLLRLLALRRWGGVLPSKAAALARAQR